MLILPVKKKWFCMILSGEKEEWGAEKGVEYYVLTVHRIVWRSMDNMGGYLKTAV